MTAADWPKWADMDWLRLLEGPADLVTLPLAPTMASITYRGERYFRMPDIRSGIRAGESPAGLSHYGGAYLWQGWMPGRLAALEAATPPGPGGLEGAQP